MYDIPLVSHTERVISHTAPIALNGGAQAMITYLFTYLQVSKNIPAMCKEKHYLETRLEMGIDTEKTQRWFMVKKL